ncbi:class III extradiol ring-cleavage dioxygenase family protein [Nocardiopsis oceani]
MIVGAAVCPHPPLLLRELTGGQDVAAELREACGSALSALLAHSPDVVLVVGGAEVRSGHRLGPVPVRAYGGTGERVRQDETLPLSLGVARRLLDDNGTAVPVETVTVAWDATLGQVEDLAVWIAARPERVALLVMGDGSARRGAKAPGHLDERSFGFDEGVRRALARGDAAALLHLPPGLAAELMAAGRAAWQVMASAAAQTAEPVRAKLLYADDPFGVMYLVAVWSCGSS